MRIAVTGASGFIGRHVAAELADRGLTATLICRSPSDLGDLVERHAIVTFDLRTPPSDSFDAIGRPNVLIHLAWGGLPNYDSLHHFEDELPSHYRFLKSLIAGGLENLLVAGTCLEYGMQTGALHEDLDARPVTPYGFAKSALRVQLEYLQRVTAFNLTWARLFYLHGPGQAATSLFPRLEAAVTRGDRAFQMSGGEQLRDYLPVTDVARDLVSLALTQRNSGIVNVCSGRPISVRRLVEGWIVEHGWSIDLDLGQVPYPEYEPLAFWGDRRKLDRCLGLVETS